MELLVALAVTSIVILYFFAMEKIGRQDLFNADHRAKVQNDVSYVIDQMSANINGKKKLAADNVTYQIRGGAIGNTQISSQYPVDTTQINGDNAIKIWIDSNNTGQWDSGDVQIAYRYSPASNYQIWYYPGYTIYTGSLSSCDCPDPTNLATCCEVLTGNRIKGNFSDNTSDPTYVACIRSDTSQPTACSTCRNPPYCNNYLDVQISGCWEPNGATLGACDSASNPNPKNPSVTMHSYIKMPSVSTN